VSAWWVVVPAGMLGSVAVVILRRKYLVVTVLGQSMTPAYRPYDRVLVRRVSFRRCRTGDVVVARRPGRGPDWRGPDATSFDGQRWIVKRVVALPGDPLPVHMTNDTSRRTVPAGMTVLWGDNPTASFDSREFGMYPVSGVVGMVLRRLPAGRIDPDVTVARTVSPMAADPPGVETCGPRRTG
jgi:signal peptidase I